jgi:hypothetical protein
MSITVTKGRYSNERHREVYQNVLGSGVNMSADEAVAYLTGQMYPPSEFTDRIGQGIDSDTAFVVCAVVAPVRSGPRCVSRLESTPPVKIAKRCW